VNKSSNFESRTYARGQNLVTGASKRLELMQEVNRFGLILSYFNGVAYCVLGC